MGSPVPGTDFEAKAHVCTAILKTLEEPGVVVCACYISTGEDEGGGSSGGWRSVQLQRVLGHSVPQFLTVSPKIDMNVPATGFGMFSTFLEGWGEVLRQDLSS